MNRNILIADDDELYRFGMKNLLKEHGNVFEASSLDEVQNLLETTSFDLAFIDIDFGDKRDGLEIVPQCVLKNIYTVVFSCNDDKDTVANAYKRGCDSFFSKGEEQKCINSIILKLDSNKNKDSIDSFLKERFITTSTFIKEQIIEATKLTSCSDISLIIQGPTGVGKSTLAKYIHDLCPVTGEFVDINCSEINPNLIESELFGHKKGAFTGAINNKMGRILKADNGTLFIDEICSMPLDIQTKLLKVLEDKTFYPVGSDRSISSNFRIICAGQKHLLSEVELGNFRADLYYRLSGFTIYLPAINERKDDIKPLLNFFLKGSKKILFADQAMNKIQEHLWPGNIRELKKLADFIKSKDKGFVQKEDLPNFLLGNTSLPKVADLELSEIKSIGLKNYIKSIEKAILKESLKENNFSIRPTLRDLKISFSKYYALTDENNQI